MRGSAAELILQGSEGLLKAGIEEGREECERILMRLLGCSRSDLYLKDLGGVPPEAQAGFLSILEKRARRVPLAYLLNEAYFGDEVLFVDERCLIPRPETEILVEQILKVVKTKSFSFLDIGTGSGAIAVAILRACPEARGTLLDASQGALEVARKNLERYGLQARATLVLGDLFGSFSAAETWDLIVSNPPYLSEKDWDGLQEELRFEPREALDGGKDGLDFYRRIIGTARVHLAPKGLLALEVGLGQAGAVSKWLHEAGYVNIQRFPDHSGIERVIIAER